MEPRHRTRAAVHPARPDWDWDGFRPESAVGWAALALAAAHVGLLVVLQATHEIYWQPYDLWADPHVVAAATGFALTAIGGAIAALVVTVRRIEHSALMLVPVLIGAFWAFWLLDQLAGWLA